MEILSIPLRGKLEHADSLGNHTILHPGEAQLMSTGTGMFHFEKNPDLRETLQMIQIWILPVKRNFPPKYQKVTFSDKGIVDRFFALAGPESSTAPIKLRQNAFVWLGKFENGKELRLPDTQNGFGFFIFVVSGKISIFDLILGCSDAAGIRNGTSTIVKTQNDSLILLMQLPLQHEITYGKYGIQAGKVGA
jgi:redox-sensitive bicupin YhaK (pirin superfamily)